MEVPLRLDAPSWWNPPEAVYEAADTFDTGYKDLCDGANERLGELKREGPTQRAEVRFENAVLSLRRQRYHVQPLRVGNNKGDAAAAKDRIAGPCHVGISRACNAIRAAGFERV